MIEESHIQSYDDIYKCLSIYVSKMCMYNIIE